MEDSDVEAGVYFAACCAREWYRVDIYDPTRMGESVVVCYNWISIRRFGFFFLYINILLNRSHSSTMVHVKRSTLARCVAWSNNSVPHRKWQFVVHWEILNRMEKHSPEAMRPNFWNWWTVKKCLQTFCILTQT